MFDYYKGFNSMGNEMDIINLMTTNVQNLAVPGYKAANKTFEEIMNEGVGLGAFDEATNPTFTQGKVKKTGNALDLAIQDSATGKPCSTFFVLSDGNRTRYTRTGHFSLKEGKLIDPFSSLHVQGFLLDSSGNKKSDQPQDVELPYDPTTGLYGGAYTGFRFGDGGKLLGEIHLSDPLTGEAVTKTVPLFQVALAQFADPGSLAQASPTSYQETGASGKPVLGVVGDDRIAAEVNTQHLEMSNVDLPSMYQSMILARMVYDVQLTAFKAMNKMTTDAAALVK